MARSHYSMAWSETPQDCQKPASKQARRSAQIWQLQRLNCCYLRLYSSTAHIILVSTDFRFLHGAI